ncbi:hypothetical protein FJZ53_03435 [Candidatus Woesearchaeota archaeon]|nr:hypothetical protein [Candidatus Woesearchaeota archaeon]
MIRIFTIIIIALFMFSMPASAQWFDEDYTGEPKEKQEEQVKEKPDLSSTVERGRIFQGEAYYYDKEKNRTYPQTSNTKFAVVFDTLIGNKEISELVKPHRNIINAYSLEISTIGGTCVVFEIDETSSQDVFDFINTFNKLKIAKYASPIILIDGKEYIFSGLFELKLKETPDNPNSSKTVYDMIESLEISRKEIVEGRHNCFTYQVNLKENGRTFFQLINFLAEDPRVVYAVPILTPVTPLIEIVQEVELKGARLGSRIPYKVTIRKDSRIKIDPSVLTNLKISQAYMTHKLDPYDPKDIIEGTEIVITGYVQFFIVGEQTIEPRKVGYLLEENGKTVKGEVVSNELVIKIASLVPEESPDGIIAKTPFNKYSAEKVITGLKQNRNMALALGLASVILCIIAMVKFSMWIVRDRKSKKGNETINPLPEAVQALKNAISSTKDYDYAKKVDAAIRNWLSVKTGEDFRTGTVKNIKARLEATDFGLAQDVSKALEKCEEIMSREESDPQIQNLTLELEQLTSKLA